MRFCFIALTVATLIPASCATGPGMTRRSEKAEQTRMAVERIIESGNYLIRMDRLDSPGFGSLYLTPSANFILLDKGLLQVKLGYAGRQYDLRGIAAINLKAKPTLYEISRNESRGIYDIKIKVSQGGEPFDIFLSVTDRGHSTAMISNPRIQTARYSGRLFIP